MSALKSQISALIEAAEPEQVWVPTDFAQLGSRDAIDKTLQRMVQVLERTEKVLAANGNIAEEDTAFHIALVDATHNSVLVRVLNAFYRFTAKRRVLLFSNRDQAKASVRDHRKLIELIRQRDEDKAATLILNHMNRARSYWSTMLGEPAERTTRSRRA